MEQSQTEVQEQTANAATDRREPPTSVAASGAAIAPAGMPDLRNGASRQRRNSSATFLDLCHR